MRERWIYGGSCQRPSSCWVAKGRLHHTSLTGVDNYAAPPGAGRPVSCLGTQHCTATSACVRPNILPECFTKCPIRDCCAALLKSLVPFSVSGSGINHHLYVHHLTHVAIFAAYGTKASPSCAAAIATQPNKVLCAAPLSTNSWTFPKNTSYACPQIKRIHCTWASSIPADISPGCYASAPPFMVAAEGFLGSGNTRSTGVP